MTKSLQNRKSSHMVKKRRKSSERRSLSGSIKRSETTASHKELSQKSSPSVPLMPEKQKINYQDELVLIFFNSMLDNIIEEWITIPDEPPMVCFCNVEETEDVSVTKDFKEVSPNDVQNMIVADVQGSALSLSKKGKSSLKSSSSLKNQGKYDSLTKSKKHASADRNAISEMSLRQNSKLSTEMKKSLTSSGSNMSSLQHSNVSLDWFLNPPDENVIIKFKNGNYYEGPVSKKVMHGSGKFIWADGAIYEGEFVHGDATGKGRLQYPDLTVYSGNFCKSFLHGEGVLNISSTWMIYSGNWKAGEKHGQGWLFYEPGNWYEGQWFEDKRQGTGLRQYETGVRYKGKWYQGERHGQGTIIWPNNDLYKGEWFNGKMHGYGEYIWNAFLNETFTFPLENTYQGAWINGMRNGVGIMNFGTEGGSKLAGIWKDNKKHGPGVMLCGNGTIVERNPLFWCDKPIHLETEADAGYPVPPTCSCTPCPNQIEKTTSDVNVNKKSTFQLIVEQLQNRSVSIQLEPEILESIAISRERNKSSAGFTAFPPTVSKRPSFFSGEAECSPLQIPIHVAPEQTDFSHYINLAVQKYTAWLYKTECLMKEIENANVCGGIKSAEGFPSTISKYSKWNILGHSYDSLKSAKDSQISPKNITRSSSEIESKLIAYQEVQTQIEEKHLRNTIIAQLPNLRKVYNKYATTACPHTINFKPTLIRYFLWQMLRDLNITGKIYTLFDLDNILIENPECGLETEHYPFEKIYFWQFLQILVTLAWLLHSSDIIREECKRFGVLSTILNEFLTEVVYKNPGLTFACSLFAYRDLLPINNVYQLYKKLGEPHTARKFLCNACTKKREHPPCYLKIFPNSTPRRLISGRNTVSVGGNVTFLRDDPPGIGEMPEEPYPQPPRDDPFRKELFILRSLGPKKVVECLVNVCPHIVDKGVIVNMDYPLLFIEFYETLLLCTYMIVDKNKKREEKMRLEEEKTTLDESILNEADSRSTLDNKMGKSRKKSKTK